MKKKPKNLRQVNALTIIIFVCAIFWLMPLVLIFINSFKHIMICCRTFWLCPSHGAEDVYGDLDEIRFPVSDL
mgnify:CR=1 FL=1